VKYVRNLLSITACGEHCVLATRADDSSGQVTDKIYVHVHAVAFFTNKHSGLGIVTRGYSEVKL